jgi:hypothetical protein
VQTTSLHPIFWRVPVSIRDSVMVGTIPAKLPFLLLPTEFHYMVRGANQSVLRGFNPAARFVVDPFQIRALQDFLRTSFLAHRVEQLE